MSPEFSTLFSNLGLLVGDAKCCVALLKDREPTATSQMLVETTERHIAEVERARDALLKHVCSQP